MLNKTAVIPCVRELEMEKFQVCAALGKAILHQLGAPLVLKHLLPILVLVPLIAMHKG